MLCVFLSLPSESMLHGAVCVSLSLPSESMLRDTVQHSAFQRSGRAAESARHAHARAHTLNSWYAGLDGWVGRCKGLGETV